MSRKAHQGPRRAVSSRQLFEVNIRQTDMTDRLELAGSETSAELGLVGRITIVRTSRLAAAYWRVAATSLSIVVELRWLNIQVKEESGTE
jgi:hypothetical protein